MPKPEPKLRIIALGGLEEVGRNMTIFEYDRNIIIVDMGLQFPEEDMPGIDYIIPNISYLRGKEKYIRGVIITHGHYDHIGAIPHLMDKLGNPTIFTARLTRAMIEKRQAEYKNKEKLNIQTIDLKSKVNLGPFKIEFFKVNHNIPDGLGLGIKTPCGTIVHTGDFKFDPTPYGDKPADISKIAKYGSENVLALCSDSTGAELEGHSISEKKIMENLRLVFGKTKGRLIISTFSSLITRIQQIFWLAEETGRKVAIDGYSMKTNISICRQLGYLKIKRGIQSSLKEILRLPKNKIVILCTGAQGEERSVLIRIANKEHRQIQIEKGDTVVFSSSVVPGNERTVQRLKDTLTRQGAEIFHYKMMDIHAGGHAQKEDLKMMISLTRPKYLIPIHGNHYMLKLHKDIGKSMGIKENNIFVADNGQIMEFDRRGIGRLTPQKVPSDYVMVDGLGVGDVSNIVLRDRQMLSEDGIVVIIATIDGKTGDLVTSPDIISRGFVYMRKSKALIEQTRSKVKKILKSKDPRTRANYAYIKNQIRDSIGQFLYSKTERRPMILPVIVEV